MKRIFSVLLFFAIGVGLLWGVPSIRTSVVFTQKDGSKITILLYGDEFASYRTTSDGYQIVEIDGIYYYYQIGVSTKSTAELVRANDPANRTAAERDFLGIRPKGMQFAPSNDAMRTQYTVPSLAGDPFAKNTTRKVLPPKALVLLVQFSDVKFVVNTTDIKNMFTQQGYSKNGATGCVQDYFKASSMGAYVPDFEVSPILTLDKPVAYYGKKTATSEDQYVDLMVAEACRLADPHVNFADFSSDGRCVDGVYVIFAGHNQAEGASENTIWPQRWTLNVNYPNEYFDGVQVRDFTCVSELRGASGTTQSGIGTFCHEFGHVLGLPDFYDTDAQTGGQTVGLYNISIMGGGNYNNNGNTPPFYSAVERWMLGWNKFYILEESDQLTIKPIHEENDAWAIYSKASKNEFYVIESRGATSWDAPLKNTGLLIYHVDMTTNMADGKRAIDRWNNNSINNSVAHPCMRLVESAGRPLTANEQSSLSNYSNVFYPGQVNNKTFNGMSYGGRDWLGNSVQMQLFDITNSNGTVTARVRSLVSGDGVIGIQAAQYELIVKILTEDVVDKFVLAHKASGAATWNEQDVAFGTKSVLIKNLTPDTAYDIQLYTVVGDKKTSVSRSQYSTQAISSPYSAISGIRGSYSVGQTIEAKVTNLKANAQSVVFELDGTQIADGVYTFKKLGTYTLKCTVTNADGEKEFIIRKIKVL